MRLVSAWLPKVVTLSEATTDAALALGVRPVGTTAVRGQQGVSTYLAGQASKVQVVGSTLEALGMTRPKDQQGESSGHSEPVSLEKLSTVDGDWMFFGTLSDRADGEKAYAAESAQFQRVEGGEEGPRRGRRGLGVEQRRRPALRTGRPGRPQQALTS